MTTMTAHRHSAATSRHTTVTTRIGDLTLVADGDIVTGIYFPEHWTLPDPAGFGTVVAQADSLLAAMGGELAACLDGDLRTFTTAYRADGTELERAVWADLEQIGYGATTTYGRLAAAYGKPAMAQAIGHIVGANPLSIVIPCHRVVGADGSLTGYAGGLGRKRYLLDLEAYLTGQTLIDPRD
jgi:methylated-DNA-[protein]-cysteine S-methyltransferase